MSFKEIHKSFANVFIIGLFICAINVFWRLTTIESYWLFATAVITGFYFSWGYTFLGEKVYYSRTIFDFFFDFIIALILCALMLIIPSLKLKIWLFTYLLLFCLALIKYIIVSFLIKAPGQSHFVRKKILTNITALIFVCFMAWIALIAKKELIAIILLFSMEFLHILYVSFVDRIYDF